MNTAEQLSLDILLYGNAYIHVDQSGNRNRIDPSTIVLTKGGGKVEEHWVNGCRDVLQEVLTERRRQVEKYGHNDECEDGTGPDVRWLRNTDVNLDLCTATEIEKAFRQEYERHDTPTWMHLVREEVAEAFEAEPGSLRQDEELIQVAALCVSWAERNRRNRRG